MADTSNLTNFLNDVAQSIKDKKGTTEKIPAANFDTEIASIDTVKGEEVNIEPSTERQVITPSEGKNAITKATINSVTANIDTNIVPNNIKKDVSILGVVGTLEEGSQINNQDKNITTNGTYQADSGYTGLGTVTVEVPQEGTDTSDATATANDLKYNTTAYVKGKKITGTISEVDGLLVQNASQVSLNPSNNLINFHSPQDNIFRQGSTLSANYNYVSPVIGLTPEKIVKGNTIIGVEGTAESQEINNQDKTIIKNGTYRADEGYTGLGTIIVNVPQEGDIPVKLFETVEQMQADTTAKENDLAIVYRDETADAKVDSVFQTATFPQTVVLNTAITDYIDVRYNAVDGSMFDCMGSLDSSRFSMDCYGDSGSVRVQYTSSDGITYTRTQGEDTADFGTEIRYAYPDQWNDAIGKFIQVGGMKFDGFYQYTTKADKNYVNGFTNFVNTGSTVTSDKITVSFEKAFPIIKKVIADNSFDNGIDAAVIIQGNSVILYTLDIKYTSEQNPRLCFQTPYIAFDSKQGYVLYYNGSSSAPSVNIRKITLDLDNQTYSMENMSHDLTIYDKAYSDTFPLNAQLFSLKFYGSQELANYYPRVYAYYKTGTSTVSFAPSLGNNTAYYFAPTQLNAEKGDLMPNKTAYSNNGIITGDEGVINNIPKSMIRTIVDCPEENDIFETIMEGELSNTYNVLKMDSKNYLQNIDISNIFCNSTKYNVVTKNLPMLYETNIYSCVRYRTESPYGICIYNKLTGEYKQFDISEYIRDMFVNDNFLIVIHDKTAEIFNLVTDEHITYTLPSAMKPNSFSTCGAYIPPSGKYVYIFYRVEASSTYSLYLNIHDLVNNTDKNVLINNNVSYGYTTIIPTSDDNVIAIWCTSDYYYSACKYDINGTNIKTYFSNFAISSTRMYNKSSHYNGLYDFSEEDTIICSHNTVLFVKYTLSTDTMEYAKHEGPSGGIADRYTPRIAKKYSPDCYSIGTGDRSGVAYKFVIDYSSHSVTSTQDTGLVSTRYGTPTIICKDGALRDDRQSRFPDCHLETILGNSTMAGTEQVLINKILT